MSNKHKHTLQSILDRINRDEKALERALIVMWDNATEIQRRSRIFDLPITVWIWCIKEGGRLGDAERDHARMKLAQVKYYGILRRCADQIMEGEG